jgi:hypothetical protein
VECVAQLRYAADADRGERALGDRAAENCRTQTECATEDYGTCTDRTTDDHSTDDGCTDTSRSTKNRRTNADADRTTCTGRGALRARARASECDTRSGAETRRCPAACRCAATSGRA